MHNRILKIVDNGFPSFSVKTNGGFEYTMEYYPGISVGRPKNPDYSLATERLDTFKNWPRNGIVTEELSKAGFYATGSPGSVRCFFCAGGLQDFEEDDNPWIEHAKHYPDCDFLRLYVDNKFIKGAQNADEQETKESLCKHVKKHFVPDQLIEDLNSKASLLVMKQGYKQEDVEQAIEKAREKHGSGDLMAKVILESLFESETFTKPFGKDTCSFSPPTKKMDMYNGHSEPEVHVPFSFGDSDSRSVGEEAYTGVARDSEQGRLLEENRSLKNRIACKICLDNDACIVFTPCGHMVSCMKCSGRQNRCAVCRADIEDRIRAYPA